MISYDKDEVGTWRYCECGCHQSVIDLGGAHYSVFMATPSDPKNQHLELYRGQHTARRQGVVAVFKSWNDLDRFMVDVIDKHLLEMKRQAHVLKRARDQMVKKGRR